MPINKQKLAQKIAKRSLLNRQEAERFIDDLTDIILEEIKKGEEVNIVGFGKFFPYVHAERPVRNPKTKEEMVLDSYTSMKFKTSIIVKRVLKTKYEQGKKK